LAASPHFKANQWPDFSQPSDDAARVVRHARTVPSESSSPAFRFKRC
jgi:hypothetical protein